MPYLESINPLDMIQRAEIAIKIVSEKFESIRLVREIDWDLKTHNVIQSNIRDVDPIVRVTSDSGESYDVCPWCKAIHPAKRFNETGLFFHGSAGKMYNCNRPRLVYTHEECGQFDYGKDWGCG